MSPPDPSNVHTPLLSDWVPARPGLPMSPQVHVAGQLELDGVTAGAGGVAVLVAGGAGGVAVLVGVGGCAVLVAGGAGGVAVLVGVGGCAVLVGVGGCAVLVAGGAGGVAVLVAACRLTIKVAARSRQA